MPRYTASFTGTVGANPALGYVVAYQTPSWNSGAVTGGRFDPGYLGVENATNGSFIASYQINVREKDALLTSDATSKWEATFGWVDLNTLANGDVECLWSSGVYGYGRYIMKPYVKITGMTVSEGIGFVSVDFIGDGSGGQLQRSTSLSSPNWQNVGDVTPMGSPAFDLSPPAAPAYYRIRMVP